MSTPAVIALQGACPGKLPQASGLHGGEITVCLEDCFHITVLKTYGFFFHTVMSMNSK